jgi:hypothetical protein
MSDNASAGKASLLPIVGCRECGRDRCLIDGLCDDCTIKKHGCLFPCISLLVCPFCGSSDIGEEDGTGLYGIDTNIHCRTCPALVTGKTIEEARRNWNRRANF